MSENSNHQVIIDNRKSLMMQGVLKVENFDTEKIELETTLGGMLISGEDLHVEQLQLEEHQLVVRGQINSVAYVESNASRKQKRNKNLMQRLTR